MFGVITMMYDGIAIKSFSHYSAVCLHLDMDKSHNIYV